MEDYVIAEEYTLPSLGKVYSKPIDPDIKIRSMTTEEEMKRLAHSESQFKLLSEIIDDCLIKKPGISAYDMCIGDYQFLMHKLRVVTYGADYKINTTCPVCGKLNEETIDLDKLEVVTYSEDIKKYLNITLPRSKKNIELRLQTPRLLDEVNRKSKDLLKKSPNIKGEPAILFTLQSIIAKVDGEVMDPIKLESFVRHLPAADTNFILKSIEKIDLGVNPRLVCNCTQCGTEYNAILPITGEFFGPSID